MTRKTMLMPKEYTVRYGRNYKIVLALVLPCLLVVPFILVLSQFESLEEWQVWLIIYAFLGGVLAFAVWLVFRVYPKVTFGITKSEIRLSFNRPGFLGRSDFSIHLSDIKSLTRKELGGDAYFLIETQNPYRKFQISPSSSSVEDLMSFDRAMSELIDLVGKHVHKA